MALSQNDRASVYHLLSGLFARELTPDGLLALSSAASSDSEPPARVPQLRPVFDRAAQIAQTPEAAEVASTDLAGAYAYLFLGVGGPNGAPPYESVFRDERGRTSRAPAAAMRQALAELDTHIEDTFPEPADHVAIELAVAATLAENGVPNERQSAFLRDRLAGWLPGFAAACARGDRTGFYAVAARAATDFVSTDLIRLDAGPIPIVTEDDHA